MVARYCHLIYLIFLLHVDCFKMYGKLNNYFQNFNEIIISSLMTFTAGFGSHDEGHVSVCYSEDGQHIISGGTDGDIKIYSGTNNTEVG